ncbi:hypothetical protein ACWZHB_25265 [Nocardia sp. FBN12]|uniref:hypothetical protein n=1 Tax=Nocardia sp. FBN12 TaxID=3419766 RepID=UPI003D00F6A1
MPWTEIARRCRAMSDRHPEFRYLTDIVDSVMESGFDQHLAVQTTMHDLVVTVRPISPGRIEEVVVRAPGSLVPAADGTLVIECFSDTRPA